MSKSLTSFDNLLRRTFEIVRQIEAIYIKSDATATVFPRSQERLLASARQIFPELEIEFQSANLKPQKVVKAVTLILGPWKARVVLLPSDEETSRYEKRFVAIRAIFEVILQSMLPAELIATSGAVMEIDHAFENAMSENFRELNATSLLDTLSDVAAAEFLFPFRERLKIYAENPDQPSIRTAERRFEIPPGIARYYLNPAMITAFQEMPLLNPPQVV